MPAVFASGMVVQRDGFMLYGRARPGAKVSAQWDGAAFAALADAEGVWELALPGAAPGGPYVLIVSSEETCLTFSDVWAGEVWLASGQSNMELRLRETDDSPAAAQSAADAHVRYFSQKAWMAPQPQEEAAEGRWARVTPQTAYDVSAIGFYVGVQLSRALRMPVGILYAALGGRDIECFMSPASLATCGRTAFREGQSPSVVYNAMLCPLRGYGIRGVLWYQGENNGDEYPERYAAMFSALIKQFRADWRDAKLPFLFVQLPRYGPPGTRYNWCVVREAQEKVWRETPDTGMVVAIDTGEQDYVHPSEKRVVSKRLADLAEGMVYGRDALWRYPYYQACHAQGDALVIQVGGNLLRCVSRAKGLEICGADGVFYPAQAKVTPRAIYARAEQVPCPIAARYAWDNYPEADIVSEDGLPLGPFRTDTLPAETVRACPVERPRPILDHVTDTLDNWEFVWEREGVWSFHVDTSGAFGKSGRRVRKWTEEAQWLVYRVAHPARAASVWFMTRRSPHGAVVLYGSADGAVWQPIETVLSDGIPVTDGWISYRLTPQSLPHGMRYLKVALPKTPCGADCHDPMLARVEIACD